MLVFLILVASAAVIVIAALALGIGPAQVVFRGDSGPARHGAGLWKSLP